MPTMKIRGSDLDIIEYEFNSFPPGKNLKTSIHDKKKEAASKYIYIEHPKV